MKRTALTLTLVLVLLFLAVGGTQFVSLVSANPSPQPPMPETPDLHKPSIAIQLPENNKTYNVNTVPYSLTVKPPSSWFNYYPVHGTIMSISYILDENQEVTISGEIAYYEQGPFDFKGTLSDLSEGNHSIEVYVRSDSFYDPPNRPQPPFGQLPSEVYHLDTYSNKVNFTIDTTPPIISSFSVENRTYNTTEIPLNFEVNEPTSSITYCLDNTSNITIAGNTTLTGLSVGAHNLTVYAWDAVGNIGASQNIDFVVVQETEPEPEPFPATLVIVSIASVAVVGVGLLVYFRKRNHVENTNRVK
jgi:hypothetical protein